MAAGNYAYIQDYNVGRLSAGNHTITITTDVTEAVTESSETDNNASKTMSWAYQCNPNLITNYTPSGWSGPIVVSSVSGTTTDGPNLSNCNNTYIDWAVDNYSPENISQTFYVYLYIDGIYKMNWPINGLKAYYYYYWKDINIGMLSAGNHTITITTDATNTVTESSETDNSFSKTLSWVQCPGPQINSITPNSGPAGTDYQVTISGSNFGSSQGNSTVMFPNGEIAPIVSWQNNTIVCKVPSGASSGTVQVKTGWGNSNAISFQVTFGYLGRKWYCADYPIKVYMNQDGTLDLSDEFTQIQNAFNTWDNAVSTTLWMNSGLTNIKTLSQDGINLVFWDEAGTYFPSSSTIAFAQSWVYLNDPNHLAEVDIVLNGRDYIWSSSGAVGKMDILNILVHELGHFFGLADLYGTADAEKTMYGNAVLGETKKRTLESSDTAGISYIVTGCP
ncbi:MAG: IPT/TIG domain-containing protein [Candidatus Schekmanbacteria bacterium]|nr:IPT/TIG domain-containing protein [Candidatus Schekmanbacteria bacterium]